MGRRKKKQNEWLPKYVTECKGYWIYRPWNSELKKFEKQVSIGPVGMLKSDFFKKYEAIVNGGRSVYTLHWLWSEYKRGPAFDCLGETTKQDREYYYKWLSESYQTSYGFWSDIPLDKYSKQLIRQFMDSMAEKKTMSNNILRFLRVLFGYGRERFEFIRENPCEGVKQYSVSDTAARYVEDDEYRVFLEYAAKSEAYYLAPMIEIMYLCCLRTKEVLNLKREDLTDTHLICRRTKGSLDTRVRLSDRLRSAIETKNKAARVHNFEYIFYDNEGQPITYNALYGAWRRAMAKYLKDDKRRVKFRMHDLKHKGITDNKDEKAGGHKTEQMRQKYKHSIDDTEPTR